MTSELQCIQAAGKLKQAEFQKQLDKLSWPCYSIKDLKMEWMSTASGKLFQVLIYPLVLVFFPIIVLLLFIVHRQDKKALQGKIQVIMDIYATHEGPEEKNLVNLWRRYGLDRHHDLNEQIQLLSEWVATLYGEDTLTQCDIRRRVDEIRRRQFAANVPHYKREEGAGHFLMVPPVEWLATELSTELPPYMPYQIPS